MSVLSQCPPAIHQLITGLIAFCLLLHGKKCQKAQRKQAHWHAYGVPACRWWRISFTSLRKWGKQLHPALSTKPRVIQTLFFPSRSSFSCHPRIVPAPSHLSALWDPGRETRMSPELAQPSSAEGRKHSHWGNQVEHGATCEKPISIPCIIMARWIAERRGFFLPWSASWARWFHLWTLSDFYILISVLQEPDSASRRALLQHEIRIKKIHSADAPYHWCIVVLFTFSNRCKVWSGWAPRWKWVPLLACGLFHPAPIYDVTSFPEWVICPGSFQRINWSG